MVFDLDNSSFNGNNYISYIASNYDDNFARWNARSGHIGQEKMSRLARESLLNPIARISLPTYEHFLAGKVTKKPRNSHKDIYFIVIDTF